MRARLASFSPLLLLLASPGLPGCATGIHLNANRFDSPECRGKLWRGHVDVAPLHGGAVLDPVPDVTAVPLQIDAPTLGRSDASLRGSLGLGIFEDLDADLKLTWNGPVVFQAKYQLVGTSELRGRADNFALAVSGAAGFALPTGDRFDYSFGTYDLAVIAGQRFAETFMLYGGPFFTLVNYSGKVTRPTMSPLPVSGSAMQGGAHLGLQLDSVLASLKLEEAWAGASAGDVRQTGFYTGLNLSMKF